MTAETPQPPVGIDLGTTYSVTAYLDATGRPVTCGLNGQGTDHSIAIFVDQDDILVGKQAVKKGWGLSGPLCRVFQADMGLVFFRHKVRGLDVPPEVLGNRDGPEAAEGGRAGAAVERPFRPGGHRPGVLRRRGGRGATRNRNAWPA